MLTESRRIILKVTLIRQTRERDVPASRYVRRPARAACGEATPWPKTIRTQCPAGEPLDPPKSEGYQAGHCGIVNRLSINRGAKAAGKSRYKECSIESVRHHPEGLV
jgi:hypothetical protein